MHYNAGLHERDARPSDVHSGASPSPSICQRSPVCLFLHFFCLAFLGKEMGDVVGVALCCVICLAR